jgi:8-oxo-dGTP pyrophosphatase MutT (NUDIX family)
LYFDGQSPQSNFCDRKAFSQLGFDFWRNFIRNQAVAGCEVERGLMKRRANEQARQVQYAALPYRTTDKSQLEVMLVTTRGTRRWIIPKGWPKRGKPPHDAAAEEAFEERGVVGKVSKRSIGSFPYDKILEEGTTAPCHVRVFPLRVTQQHKTWPEKRERKVAWYPPAEAARFVGDPELRRIILAVYHNLRSAALYLVFDLLIEAERCLFRDGVNKMAGAACVKDRGSR